MSNTEAIIPSVIENTTMEMVLKNGKPIAYYIYPNQGYVLHDKEKDTPEYDEETMRETGNVILGYAKKIVSCSVNYDFIMNPRELYAIPADEIIKADSQEVHS